MRILIVVPAIGSVYGGSSKTVVGIAAALAAKGASVDLATTAANGTTLLNVRTDDWVVQNGYRVRYFPHISFGDYKFSFEFWRWISRQITNYDLIHINACFSLFNLPALWVARHKSVPYVVTPHGMLEPWALNHKGFKKKLYFDWIERPLIDSAAALHFIALAEKNKTETLRLNSAAFVVPNGIDRDDLLQNTTSDIFFNLYPDLRGSNIILFLGRIDPKKGLDLLAPAFAKVVAKYPSTRLVVAGPDNVGYMPTAKKLFDAAGCSSAVVFTGMLTGQIKQAALSASNVFVAPSYSEGFSISILEAMGRGLPCVFTTGCNFPEAGEAGAAKVVEANTDAITNALFECFDCPDEARKMGERASNLIANQYTWDKIAGQLLNEFERIVWTRQNRSK